MQYQQTLARPITTQGPSVISDEPTNLTIKPAETDTGILFVRTDKSCPIPCSPFLLRRRPPIKWTTLVNRGVTVETVEHIVAALRGMEVDNVLVEVDRPGIPILDGSALPFVEMILEAGTVTQEGLRTDYLPITRVLGAWEQRISMRTGNMASNRSALFAIPDSTTSIAYTGYWEGLPLGHQLVDVIITPEVFANEIAPARTFMTPWEIERWKPEGPRPLLSHYFCDNVLIVSETETFEERLPDEAARHKVLDIFGDVSVCGYIKGRFYGYRSGHSLNNRMVGRMVGR